ncbi:MAG: pilus assembly protein PilM [Elusimicrobiales bacterium]|nr:pilus assembly protein PilM [Elusimicrobiales bacterium]
MISEIISAIFKTRGVIGVDIGAYSVKLSRVKPSKGRIKAVECGSFPLNLSGSESQDERTEKISGRLREYIEESGIGCRNAVILLSGTDIRISYSLIDRMPAENFEAACRKEAGRLFFNTDDLYIDYDVLGEISDDGVPRTRVVFAAAKKETVQEKINIAEQAGLAPVMIIPAVFAFERMCRILKGRIEDNHLLVTMGRKQTSMYLFGAGRAESVRNVSVGSDTADERIRALLRVKPEVAGEIKKRYPLPVSEEEKLAVINRFSREEAAAVSAKKEYMEALLQEIDPFVYLSDVKVSSVFLTGGPAADKGSAAFLEKRLKMPVYLFPAPENLSGKSSRIFGDGLYSLMPASAASLSSTIFPDLTRIDMLPAGYGSSARRIRFIFRTFFYSCLAVMALAVLFLHIKGAAARSEAMEKQETAAAAETADNLAQNAMLQKEADTVSAYVEQAEGIKRNRALYSGLTKFLVSSLPPGVIVSSLVVTPEDEGLAAELRLSSNTPAIVLKWTDALVRAEGFEKVSAGTAAKAGNSDNDYILPVKFLYKGGAK